MEPLRRAYLSPAKVIPCSRTYDKTIGKFISVDSVHEVSIAASRRWWARKAGSAPNEGRDTNEQGEVLAERTRPAPGATYVGNGRPKGRWRETPSPNS